MAAGVRSTVNTTVIKSELTDGTKLVRSGE